MTHIDHEDRRTALSVVLERTWTLFDEVQRHLGDTERHSPPDFAARAKQLIPDPHQEAQRSLSRATLDQVAHMVRSCTRCSLSSTRTQAVPGEGVMQARLMVIGEGPGAEEDATGRPFVGRAGVYLDSWLKAINLSRDSNAYIANIVKCRPPGNRDPLPEEAEACIEYLKRQITLVKPDAILCVGKVAARFLLGLDEPLKTLRSTIHRHQNVPVIVTYHPAAVLRNLQLRSAVWEDLKRAAQLIDMPISGTRG